jgi:ubiquinone biosynthesis protein UbiJ
MVHTLQSLLAPALMGRLVLVVNHVLGAEPAAMQRLAPHAGALIKLQIDGWPALLPSLMPAPPVLLWRVTPAGLLEWCEAPLPAGEPALCIRVDGANPLLLMARAAAGRMPAVDIDGDAQLAGDINWLLQNLRWDVAADLERLFGPAVAHSLHRLGSALARGIRGATQGAAGAAERMRPTAP